MEQPAWSATAYDRERDRLFLAERAQARKEIARRRAKLAQAVQSKAVARLQTLDPRELSRSELLRYIQVAAETERRAGRGTGGRDGRGPGGPVGDERRAAEG